jgi:glutamyl/glutaminyl-tRNA synthetase
VPADLIAPQGTYRGRFAPSTTGPAHLGTLLSALLCWCDARKAGGQVLLRLEDLDPQRCKPAFAASLQDDLTWLGLDWDAVLLQSTQSARHAAALDALAAGGYLYACSCSRTLLQGHGVRAPDGSWRYPNTCRRRRVSPANWRDCELPLRARLPEGVIVPKTYGAGALTQDPSAVMGDPVVRRRDKAVAYQLAVVVDDADWGVDTVVRGRDIACSTATQVALQRLLGLPEPIYWHHFLLCHQSEQKLAKLHGDTALAWPRGRLARAARAVHATPFAVGV